MKRILCFLSVMLFVLTVAVISVSAAESNILDSDIQQFEDSLDDTVSESLNELGVSGINGMIKNGLDQSKVWSYLLGLTTMYSHEPMIALTVLTAILILTSIAESYTNSLRYVETKDVMNVAVSLFTASVFIRPIAKISASAVDVISGGSSIMMTYLPIVAGIMLFSGHAVSSGSYYAAVTGVSALISRAASSILAPLLNVFLSLSVSAGICSRVRIGGLIELINKGFKYGITFLMSVFIAIIGMNGALSSAADGVAGKAARFTLSSFIPLIGSSISEAYGAIQNSANILRSGAGVFVIAAIFVSFAPLLFQTLLWSAALGIAGMVGEVLSVSSAKAVFTAVSQYLSALRALLIAVMTVFLISSAVTISIGG